MVLLKSPSLFHTGTFLLHNLNQRMLKLMERTQNPFPLQHHHFEGYQAPRINNHDHMLLTIAQLNVTYRVKRRSRSEAGYLKVSLPFLAWFASYTSNRIKLHINTRFMPTLINKFALKQGTSAPGNDFLNAD